MNAPQSWDETLGALARRAHRPASGPAFPPAPPGVGWVAPQTEAEVESRRADKERFEEARAEPLAIQRQLARDGWPGAFIDIPDTRPAVLKAMDLAGIAARSVVEVAGPGETLSTDRDAAERFRRAQWRQDVAGPT
jgi:hypothetical protein